MDNLNNISVTAKGAGSQLPLLPLPDHHGQPGGQGGELPQPWVWKGLMQDVQTIQLKSEMTKQEQEALQELFKPGTSKQ